MKKEVYLVKSLEEDFATKTLNGKKKVTYQTVENMVKTKIIKPNTVSFGRQRRLACTILDKNYTKTYRPHGIIFQTEEIPAHISPFDLVLLSATDKIIVHYYRIKNNLHIFYNKTLIPGFDKFIFKDLISLTKEYSSPEKVWVAVNKFRVKNGFKKLPLQKFRLVTYNEAIFYKPITIKPVALFGYRKNTRILAKKLNLKCYRSAKEFYEKINHG